MRGLLERYKKKNGEVGMRIRFPAWPLSSGRTVYHVSIWPHLCTTDVCMEGNHVHVDTFDTREKLEVLDHHVSISAAQGRMIEQLLEAQMLLNQETESLAALMQRQVA